MELDAALEKLTMQSAPQLRVQFGIGPQTAATLIAVTGADRQANNAMWTIAMLRMRSEARTRTYVERRTDEGMSRKEIHRYLKSYIIRELYPIILADLACKKIS